MKIQSRKRNSERRGEYLKAMVDSVNGTSSLVSVVHLTFLLFCFYVLTIVINVSDLDLLVGKNVKLAGIDAQVSLVGFFVVAPAAIVLLHLNLLVHLFLLSEKIRRITEMLGVFERPGSWPDRLHSFPFTAYVLGRGPRGMRNLAGLVAAITIIYIPLLILIVVQIRFLAYQDEVITWIHRALIWCDGAAVITVWVQSIHGGSLRSKCVPLGKKFYLIIGLFLSTIALLFTQAYLTAAIAFVGIAFLLGIAGWLLIRRPRSGSLSPKVPRGIAGAGLAGFLALLVPMAITIDGEPLASFHLHDLSLNRPIPQGDGELMVSRLIFRNQVAEHYYASRFLAKLTSQPSGAFDNFIRESSFDYPVRAGTLLSALITRTRHIDVSDLKIFGQPVSEEVMIRSNANDLVVAKKARDSITGINLDERALRGATFARTNLTKATFKESDLRGAKLLGAILREADFESANMQGALFYSAVADSAYFAFADLRHAWLSDASFVGANFYRANLTYAVLRHSSFFTSGFNDALLIGNLLVGNFDGAFFEGANMTGASFDGVFRGATFRHATMVGADLARADFSAADFGGAQLDGANLRDATLYKVIPTGGGGSEWVDLRDVKLEEAAENLRRLADVAKRMQEVDAPANQAAISRLLIASEGGPTRRFRARSCLASPTEQIRCHEWRGTGEEESELTEFRAKVKAILVSAGCTPIKVASREGELALLPWPGPLWGGSESRGSRYGGYEFPNRPISDVVNCAAAAAFPKHLRSFPRGY